MTLDELKHNIDGVTDRVRRAADAAGSRVTLVAATKTVPPEYINAAIELGITDIGENRVQEYVDKRDVVKPVKWHFIGTLQRNKAKYLVGNTELIQSVNSAELLTEINRLAEKRGVRQKVLIEVNAAGEASKTGASLELAEELIALSKGLSGVEVKGIMSVPPICADDGVYKTLYGLFERYKSAEFDTLSVGMSGDFEKAIAFGSNTVRIGTAIFGQRAKNPF